MFLHSDFGLHSHNKVISIHETGVCFDKEQEFHGSCCCISWGKRDKGIGPLLIKHKIYNQGVGQLELGFSLGQCLRTNTEF